MYLTQLEQSYAASKIYNNIISSGTKSLKDKFYKKNSTEFCIFKLILFKSLFSLGLKIWFSPIVKSCITYSKMFYFFARLFFSLKYNFLLRTFMIIRWFNKP